MRVVIFLMVCSQVVAAQWTDVAECWLTDDSYADVNRDGIVNYGDYALTPTEDIQMADQTYYIGSTGDNANDGLTLETAWASIAYAIDNHTCIAGETCTIYIEGGLTLTDNIIAQFDDVGATHTGVTFEFRSTDGTPYTLKSSNLYYLVRFNGATSGTVKFFDCVIGDATTGSKRLFVYEQDSGMDVYLNGCDLTHYADGTDVVQFFTDTTNAAGASRNIEAINTTFEPYHAIVRGTGNVGDITLGACTLSPQLDNKAYIVDIEAGGSCGDIDISDVSMGNANKFVRGIRNVANAQIDSVRLYSNCTIEAVSAVVDLPDDVLDVYIGSNTKLYSTSDHALRLGTYNPYATDGTKTSIDLMPRCTVENNTLIKSDTAGIFVATPGSRVLNNRIDGYSHVVNLYGDYCTVRGNIVTGALGLVEFSSYNYIANNTIVTTGNAYLTGVPSSETVNEYDGWQHPVGSTVKNNIFVTTGLTSYAFWDYEGYAAYDDHARGALHAADPVTYPLDDYMTHDMDNNVYYNSAGGHVVRLGTTPVEADTVAEIQTAWLTAKGGDVWNALYGATNDRNSLVVDPMLDANYNATNSQLVGAGVGGEDIGATLNTENLYNTETNLY